MIYLILGILCSSSLALIFKYTESKQMNRYAITSMNYVTASLVSLFLISNNKQLSISFSTKGVIQDIISVLTNKSPTLNANSTFYWAILLGVLAGFCFYFSFIVYQKSIRDCGASLSGMFAKLGILIPMLVSVILWKEFPTPIQTLGITLSILSIIMVNINFKDGTFHWKISLLLLFLFNGLAEFSNKLFQKYAITEYKSIFLFVVFSVALAISASATIKSTQKIALKDLIFGVLVGIPNLFSSFFLIMALDHLPTTVVFPIYSAMSIVVILLGSRLLFKEVIRKVDWIAISITLVSLIFINI